MGTWWRETVGLWHRSTPFLRPLSAIRPATDQTAVVVETHPQTRGLTLTAIGPADHFDSADTDDWTARAPVFSGGVQGGEKPDTAVADDAGTRPELPSNTEGHPLLSRATRTWDRRRQTRGRCGDTDTTVVDDAEKRTDASEPHTAVGPGSFGNAAWLFGNWGPLTWSQKGSTAKKDLADKISKVLKRGPAPVIGLCECEVELERILSAAVTEEAGPQPTSGKRDIVDRPAFEYLSLRGQEKSSIYLGVRANTGHSLELVSWDRIDHGDGKYTRALFGQITTDDNIGRLGNTHAVGVIHLHHALANNRGTKLTTFWDLLAQKTKGVDVIMGDFNMSLFRVVPELRSRGVTIDLAAWFPWKSPDGTPCADSCGIFFVNRPGLYTLKKGLKDLHANDESGILWSTPEDSSQTSTTCFDVFEEKNAPGFPLTRYLPKDSLVVESIKETLTPSTRPEALEGPREVTNLWKIKEKRVDFQVYDCMEHHQNGSHYPLCAFTQNASLRSPEKFRERQDKRERRSRGQQPPAYSHEGHSRGQHSQSALRAGHSGGAQSSWQGRSGGQQDTPQSYARAGETDEGRAHGNDERCATRNDERPARETDRSPDWDKRGWQEWGQSGWGKSSWDKSGWERDSSSTWETRARGGCHTHDEGASAYNNGLEPKT